MSEEPTARGVRTYVAVVAAIACAGLAGAAALFANDHPPAGIPGARVALASGVFVSALLVLQQSSFTFTWKGHRHRLVLDEVAVYHGLLVLPHPLVPMLVAVASVIEQRMTRRAPMKALFNVAQSTAAASICWAVFLGLSAAGAPPLLAALPAAFIFPIASNFFMAGILSRLTGAPHVRTFEERFLVDGLVAGSVGAGAGVAIVVLWSSHPVTLLAVLPFVYLTRRWGVLSALADRELEVRKRLAEVGRDLVGTIDLEHAAERILAICGDTIPSCARAELAVGDRRFVRDFEDAASIGAVAWSEPVPGRSGRVGSLTVWPRRAASGFADAERELLRIVAAQAGAAIDATRTLAESEAARSRLETYLRSAGDAVLLVHDRGNIGYMNPAARALFEVPPGDESSCRIEDLLPGLALSRAAALDSALVETAAQSSDGSRRMVVEAHATRLVEDGRDAGVLLVVRDVTERKRLEAETARQRDVLARQEKLSALGTLVAGVAHEVNNPVVYMRGAVELARLDLDDLARVDAVPPDAAKLAEHASHSLTKLTQGLDRVERITHSLKAVARQGNGERALVDLSAIAEDVADVLEVGLPQGVRLLHAHQPVPLVLASDTEMHQVVLNLVKNAVESVASTGRGGSVTLRTRADGARVLVEVEDDGPGLPEEAMRRLFEPFFTTKPAGTGLGLSLCKGIVEAHGGTLSAESAPGRGARFTVILSAASTAPT